ncbi:MAG: DUF2510 domain-containing protein [Acidimicrobiales bacterium]|jgi:uncharacterized protein DUF2510
MASVAPLGLIGAAVAVALLLFSWGWIRAARFRSERGKAPWAIPPAGWGAIYLVVPVGLILYSAASRTTQVVDPSLAYRADTVIADTAEEREKLRRIASELPLLRPPQPDVRGWHIDPYRQRRFRFYDGQRWTREVTDDPALKMSVAVGDPKAELKRRLQALPPPAHKAASWHIDPLGTYHFRYFDGQEWTEEVHKERRSS